MRKEESLMKPGVKGEIDDKVQQVSPKIRKDR